MEFKLVSDNSRKINIDIGLVNAYTAKWKEGTPFEISIVRRQPRISSPLRKFYFGIAMPIFLEAFGYNPDECLLVHRQLKIIFFGVQPDQHGIYREKDIPSVFSNESEVPMDVKMKFIEWCRRKAAEQGYYIPDVGER